MKWFFFVSTCSYLVSFLLALFSKFLFYNAISFRGSEIEAFFFFRLLFFPFICVDSPPCRLYCLSFLVLMHSFIYGFWHLICRLILNRSYSEFFSLSLWEHYSLSSSLMVASTESLEIQSRIWSYIRQLGYLIPW